MKDIHKRVSNNKINKKTYINMKSRCDNCPMRAKYDLNPKSFMGRLWRWHINFCPGWKDYMKSVDESSRERLIEKYRLNKNIHK